VASEIHHLAFQVLRVEVRGVYCEQRSDVGGGRELQLREDIKGMQMHIGKHGTVAVLRE
jgi:hypothetical protein